MTNNIDDTIVFQGIVQLNYGHVILGLANIFFYLYYIENSTSL